jgi:hypothetical protein
LFTVGVCLSIDISKFSSELTSAENEGSHAAELLEEAIHGVMKSKAPRYEVTRIVVRVFADLASLFKQRFKPKSNRHMPEDSRDLFEAFFLDFCERFPDWVLADMHTERGVETKLMGESAVYTISRPKKEHGIQS